MTNDECRAEALRRVADADRVFNNRAVVCAQEHRTIDEVYQIAGHLRQTAAVFAALAGPQPPVFVMSGGVSDA